MDKISESTVSDYFFVFIKPVSYKFFRMRIGTQSPEHSELTAIVLQLTVIPTISTRTKFMILREKNHILRRKYCQNILRLPGLLSEMPMKTISTQITETPIIHLYLLRIIPQKLKNSHLSHKINNKNNKTLKKRKLMSGFIETVFTTIANIINSMGFFGVGIGMMIESACIPLPSEIILPVGGKMVADGVITLLDANIAAAVGSIIGSLLAYVVGYYGGRPFILKYGKYFFMNEKHFYKAENTFNKFGEVTVFFGRLLPIIRTFISLPAGIAKMDIKKFLFFSTIGMLPWNFLLIYLGYEFGEKFTEIVGPIYKKFEYAVVIAIVLVILFFVIRKIYRVKKKIDD